MKRRRGWTRTILLLAFLASCLLAMASARWFGWQALNAAIQRKFPAVARIRTSELAAWLDQSSQPPPLLLDVREPAEYQVSHLTNAQQVQPGSDPATLDLPKDQPIVTYCSVGYRSAKYAQKLRQAGFTNVRNLEGSVFAWANEKRRLVDADGHLAQRVHPYNTTWGLLLRSDCRATVPPVKATGQD